MEINPVKGTHDLYLEDAMLYSDTYRAFSITASMYGYHEIETPIIEHTNLFARSAGEDSDIVTKEMYTFLDKGGRSLTLRPEMTAGVLRSIVSNKLYVEKEMPIRYFYYGPCFRYERPQVGRYREFHQFGVETLGVNSPYNDAEVILMAYEMLKSVKLNNVKIKINSLGGEEARKNYREALKEYFKESIANMCLDCQRRYEMNPLRILDCKVPEDRPIIDKAPTITDFLSEEDKKHLDKVREILEDNGVDTVIDTSLVRGLDYYTGVVFEFESMYEEAPDYGALGGGGHYAKLLSELGGPDFEGVGFSFGMERLISLYKIVNKDNLLIDSTYDFYILSLDEEQVDANFTLAAALRRQGFRVGLNYELKSMKALLKYASRIEAKYVIIMGEDEIANNVMRIKNMGSGEQLDYAINEDLPMKLQELMEEYYESHYSDKKENSEEEIESKEIN